MTKKRPFLRPTIEAAKLLGQLIELHRKERKWTRDDVSERAGISRSMLQKIEKGDVSCAIGLVFEVATILGVNLFDSDQTPLGQQLERIGDKVKLLPKTIHKTKRPISNDF